MVFSVGIPTPECYSEKMKSPLFDNSFSRLPSYFFERVAPTPLESPKLIHVTALKHELGLSSMSESELTHWLNGQESIEGEQRIATRYAGHQFGVWAGQLGDGRAISLGEILTSHSGRQEIQTKGSGLTPFSRMGDGKAVIRSSVREYLASEAMYGLGVPTTRVLALITGEDKVYRETIEKSALVARVFPSNLRFGHFEMGFHFEKADELKALIEYAQKTFYPDLSVEGMLSSIVKKTAVLMAHWQSVGFCHGVMNTDNMSVLGITLDYGPYGFLEDTVLDYVCNHSDHSGRYAYNQQPAMGMWNLERLLVCFLNEVSKEKLQEILNVYPDAFQAEYTRLTRMKLGFEVAVESDYAFILSTMQMMGTLSLDYTFFFRAISRYKKNDLKSVSGLFEYYGQRDELKAWLKVYDERLASESRSDEERSVGMLKANPKYVVKNYIAQEVIESVERGESGRLKAWLEVFYAPFEEHTEFEKYALPTPFEHKNYVVSCSS